MLGVLHTSSSALVSQAIVRLIGQAAELRIVRFDCEEESLGHGEDGNNFCESFTADTVTVNVQNLVPDLDVVVLTPAI